MLPVQTKLGFNTFRCKPSVPARYYYSSDSSSTTPVVIEQKTETTCSCTRRVLHCVSKRHNFYFCDIFVRFHL